MHWVFAGGLWFGGAVGFLVALFVAAMLVRLMPYRRGPDRRGEFSPVKL